MATLLNFVILLFTILWSEVFILSVQSAKVISETDGSALQGSDTSYIPSAFNDKYSCRRKSWNGTKVITTAFVCPREHDDPEQTECCGPVQERTCCVPPNTFTLGVTVAAITALLMIGCYSLSKSHWAYVNCSNIIKK